MGQDQKAQIKKLAETGWYFSTEAWGLFSGYPDLTANNDANITLWGHAGQDTFGDLTPSELVGELITKGLKNSGHTVLEILGCAPNQTELSYETTYVQKVQELLQERITGRKIQVKSYPMPKPGEDSTDYRFDLIGYFVYIYGSSERLNAIKEKFRLLRRVHGQNLSKTATENQKQVYDKFVEYLGGLDKIKFLTDKYGNVRKYLEEPHTVKTHKGSVKSKVNELLLQDVYNE